MTVAGKKYVVPAPSESNAEDSSYDSDYEAEDDVATGAVRSESQVSDSCHSDVSRTSSDTLAAEFAEYVTVDGSASALHSPGYAARVEFALKLGYTERLVRTALEKLGPDPEQNELLAELIKLGAAGSCSQRAEDDATTDGSSCEPNNANCCYGPARLRSVVIDGSNVAMSHGNKEVFSCRGIKICVDWFRARGHDEITVFVPKWRKEASKIDNPVADQEILGELERDRLLVFTPSRLVGGKRMVCYDDRYILKLAAELDGIVVSNDNYRDLAQENPEFRKVVEERILMYTFVNDRFMPPDDPLGRSGPTLDNFLRILPRMSEPAPPCPYAKKCTYGNKCKFRHPERGCQPQKSVTEKLVEHVQRHLQHQPLCKAKSAASSGSSSSSGPAASVAKSRSVENMTVDVGASSRNDFRPAKSENPRSRNSKPNSEPGNSHKKLQRQLTLNPVYDPRLMQLRNCQRAAAPLANVAAHRPLTRHSSHEKFSTSSHQHLSRIASAPEPRQRPFYRAGEHHPSPPTVGPAAHQPAAARAPAHPASMPTGMLREFLDARSKIHYHLANIFPEEHVRSAMLMLPFETDAVEICLAILNAYPSQQS